MGFTSSKEYAELEWPIDILITIVWVCYAVLFFGTIMKRKRKHIYVANWFYGAFIITVAVLHIGNNLAIPVTLTKSYSIYAGTVDAMMQWWYGHNAVGFFLTAGFLGIMYYFVPKQAERPVYSYRLSIVHFWALISLYVWAGGHHLHYSASARLGSKRGYGDVPDPAGTFLGRHDQRYDDTVRCGGINSVPIRSCVSSWYRYPFTGMSTFEGPMMSIKTVNALSHNTDWTIGHVHSGALGWVAMVFYWRDLSPDSTPVRNFGHVQYLNDQLALLVGNCWHGTLHRCDVGKRHHARLGCGAQ